MRSRKKHGIHAILTGWLLVLGVLIGAVADSRATVMVQHTHEEGHHRHEHDAQYPQDIHSHPCDHHETPDDHDEPHSGDDTHDHKVDLPHVPFCCLTNLPAGLMPPASDLSNLLPSSEAGSDGPIFELIKPPQIG